MRVQVPKAVRFRVLMRDQFTCQYCGANAVTALLHVDHLIPVSKGGSNAEDNLITACESCNRGKGATLLESASERVQDVAISAFEREQLAREIVRTKPSNPCSVPIDAPSHVVESIETLHQALAVSIAQGNHKLEYIAHCICKSKSYVSRMTTGERPIPEKLIGPLCAATGTNLLKQYKAFHDALQSISCEPSYEQRVARLARLMEAA